MKNIRSEEEAIQRGLRKFRITGVYEGRDHHGKIDPHIPGRELSFIVWAKSKKQVTKDMKRYDWMFWTGEDLEETEALRKKAWGDDWEDKEYVRTDA